MLLLIFESINPTWLFPKVLFLIVPPPLIPMVLFANVLPSIVAVLTGVDNPKVLDVTRFFVIVALPVT